MRPALARLTLTAVGDHEENAGRPSAPSSVLFMCGMNAIRSPMAELLAKRYLPSGTFVASAGVQAG